MILGSGRQRYGPAHRFSRAGDLPYWTLELTYSGTMLRRTGAGARFRAQPNATLLLTPPGTPYGLQGEREGEEIWVLFQPRPELLPALEWPRGSDGVRALAVPPTAMGQRLLHALEETHSSFGGRSPRRELLAENALERLILLAQEIRDPADSVPDSRIRRAVDHVHNAYGRQLTVASLASTVALSPSRFAHLFRAAIGRSPMDYVETVRMDQAQLLLLRTDLRIKEIATRVGFEDAFYFSTRFRRRFGHPPSAWRKNPRNAGGRSE